MKPLPTILEISPYVGGDVTPPGMYRRIVLASNENPFGPSPKVLEHMRGHTPNFASYPSGDAAKLRQTIGDTHNLSMDNVICGNGSEEIIHMITQTFVHAGDEVLIPEYGFLVYRIATLASSSTPVFYTQDALNHSVEAILAAVTDKTKMVFIDNPGNPLGCMLSKDDLITLRNALPDHVFLILDEAYAEFVDDESYESGLTLFKDDERVMTLRTFSKIYGLAGLRVGWGYTANKDILDALNRVRAPFNVNALAQELACVALMDKDWVRYIKDENIKNRDATRRGLSKLGYTMNPSHGNFILFDVGSKENAQSIYRFLGERGIMIRPVLGYGLSNHLRVSIGRAEDMAEFLEILHTHDEKILC